MLDPDELEELRRTPGLSYQSSGVLNHPPHPSFGAKTSGMTSLDDSSHSSDDSIGKLLFADGENDDDDDFDEEGGKTDQEVSKYSFYDRLEHYWSVN
jgi:hypothetical protein